VREAVAYRDGGGGATIEGAVGTPFTRESGGVGGWNANIATSGNDVILTVEGDAADTVNWRTCYTVIQVS
jgi:hypothetical protein